MRRDILTRVSLRAGMDEIVDCKANGEAVLNAWRQKEGNFSEMGAVPQKSSGGGLRRRWRQDKKVQIFFIPWKFDKMRSTGIYILYKDKELR